MCVHLSSGQKPTAAFLPIPLSTRSDEGYLPKHSGRQRLVRQEKTNNLQQKRFLLLVNAWLVCSQCSSRHANSKLLSNDLNKWSSLTALFHYWPIVSQFSSGEMGNIASHESFASLIIACSPPKKESGSRYCPENTSLKCNQSFTPGISGG